MTQLKRTKMNRWFREWSLLMAGTGAEGILMGNENFPHVMLGYETNFRTVAGYENPQDIHKEIFIILSTSIKTINSLYWAVKISLIRKLKKFLIFSLEMIICIDKM